MLRMLSLQADRWSSLLMQDMADVIFDCSVEAFRLRGCAGPALKSGHEIWMRGMTKSAIRVAHKALAVRCRTFPSFGSRASRHDFTQARLLALVVPRQFPRTGYRGLVTLVVEWQELRKAWGLRKVPHYFTLAYAARRFLPETEKRAFHHA
jgi:hypothetical protein